MLYNFNNAVASLKDDAKPLDEAILRDTKVYAKLMISKGNKFEDVKSRDMFMLSSEGNYIRAELFILKSNGQMVIDHRVFVNVDINSKIMANKAGKFYYVELIHPTIDVSKDEAIDF